MTLAHVLEIFGNLLIRKNQEAIASVLGLLLLKLGFKCVFLFYNEVVVVFLLIFQHSAAPHF